MIFALVPRELTRGHALFDFARIATPWILAWLGYRITKSSVDRYFPRGRRPVEAA